MESQVNPSLAHGVEGKGDQLRQVDGRVQAESHPRAVPVHDRDDVERPRSHAGEGISAIRADPGGIIGTGQTQFPDQSQTGRDGERVQALKA